MSEGREEEDVYVLLDFQGKDTRFLKQNSVYFRMSNLNETKPIIEIGEDIFEGVYEDALGTNLFFKEIENPPAKTNIFESSTPITLQFIRKQTKILKLKKIGTKPKPVKDDIPMETVNINIQEDYRFLLEKFENDTLNIDEYIANDENKVTEEEMSSEKSESEEETSVSKDYKWEMVRLPPRQDLLPEWYTSVNDNTAVDNKVNPVFLKYVKLRSLAEKPTRHEIESETIHDNRIKEASDSLSYHDFISWKNFVMRTVEEQPINLDIDKDKMDDFVNINKSIEMGIILPSNEVPRIYTDIEKQNLLSFENFINLTPLMKLIMLHDIIYKQKKLLKNINAEHSEKKNNGFSTSEQIKLLEELKFELKNHIMLRLHDVQSNNKSVENVTINLSDDYLSESDSSSSVYDDYGEDTLEELLNSGAGEEIG